MSFNDTIQKIFVDEFFINMSLPEIIINLGLVTLIGIFIYIVYSLKNKSNFYSKEFNIILVVLPIITSAIVFSMKSNLALSLGMVGALSIVRFRNAIKSSLDLLFLFWSISVGIICGGGLYSLAIILSIIIAFVLVLFDLIPNRKSNLLLVINTSSLYTEKKVINLLKKYQIYYKMKSKSIHKNDVDFIMEVRGKNFEGFMEECSKLKSVININLLSHDGNIRL